MSDQALAAIIAAFAACVYVSGLALQQQGNLRAVAAGDRRAWQVIRQPIWWIGIGVMCLGFLVHGFSLTLGSLTIVQPVQVVQIAFAVLLDARIRRTRVSGRDWSAAVLIVLGLFAFTIAMEPSAGTDFATDGAWERVFAGMLVVGALLAAGAWAFAPARAVLLGVLAGLVWGVQGALLKETSELVSRGLGDALTSWPLYATALLGLLGLVAQNLALRAGRLAVAAALITVVNPVVSSIIGLTAFDESMRTSAAAVAIAALAAVAVVWGVARLARTQASLATTEPASTG